jgi:hypothetical protein
VSVAGPEQPCRSIRVNWAAVPDAVTTQVADRVGGWHVVPAVTGDHAEIAAAVTGSKGTVFVKAAHTDLGIRSLRFELAVSEAIGGSLAPAVEWRFEVADWLWRVSNTAQAGTLT